MAGSGVPAIDGPAGQGRAGEPRTERSLWPVPTGAERDNTCVKTVCSAELPAP